VKRLLRVWNILGTLYPIIRKKLRRGTEGHFDFERGRMVISTRIDEHRHWEVESHEVFHACEHAMNTHRRLCEELKLTPKQASKVSEVYAGTVIPVFLDTLERNGFLRRPKAGR
jgi:hypothetical protein